MIIDKILDRFINKCPEPVMVRALLEHIFPSEQLDEWFKQTSVKQYERELLFSSVFRVLTLSGLPDHGLVICSILTFFTTLIGVFVYIL